MHATRYPIANITAQWFADNYPASTVSSMEKVLWHSTEGSGWPGYSGGAAAPNFTAMPDTTNRRLIWRQHFPVNMPSRALRHTRTQPTNGDHVVQIELVGTCVPGGPGMYWPNAPDWALDDIADFCVFMYREWSIPLMSSVVWRGYAASGDWQRLTDSEYNRYSGHLGHEHAPQNDHRDVGALQMQKILAIATNKLTGGPMSETNPTLTEIKQGILYYPVEDLDGKTSINVKTEIDRTYAMVSAQMGILKAIQQAEATDETVDIAALAAAIVKGLPNVIMANVDSAALADAVADAIAERMAG